MTDNQQQQRIVVDLGRFKKKEVRRLVKGREGKAVDKVNQAIAELRTTGVLENGKEPVIIVVREKKRKSKNAGPFSMLR